MVACAMDELGPEVRLVDTIDVEEYLARPNDIDYRSPLLIRRAVADWPAAHRWTFEWLAGLRSPQGKDLTARFQNGLIEQGRTQEPVELSVSRFAEVLGAAATASDAAPPGALCPDEILAGLRASDQFHLRWEILAEHPTGQAYLGQWEILKHFPPLIGDLRIRELWPRRQSIWPTVWIGPAHTITGLHNDYPHNLFCQFRGQKEFVLLSPSEAPHLSPSSKYDRGSELSRIDVRNLRQGGPEAEHFAMAAGWYARVRAGDALIIPKNTWHCVTALEPSISLSVFGLSLIERATSGVREVVLEGLHHLGLYRRGDCTCHGA
jgi:hypothetical protein